MIMTDTSQCSKRPMNGAFNGLLLAQRRDHGMIPSRPISCTTIDSRLVQLHPCYILKFLVDLHLPCANITLSTLPKAERATKTERTRSARDPNMLRKNDAARIRPELTISSLGTAAKYAIWKVLA